MGIILLTELGSKRTAVVKEIQGGDEVKSRLESMGIRPGKKITKVSAHFWRGPVTVLVDKTRIAIGHGMAARIAVEE